MNSSFSFQRLSLLIRKQWAENSRFYGLASLAMLGVMSMVFIIFWILMDHPHYREDQTVVIYFIGLFLVGCLFASTAFSKDQHRYIVDCSPLGAANSGLDCIAVAND